MKIKKGIISSFRDIIEEKTGLFFPNSKFETFEKAVIKLLDDSSFNSIDELYNYLSDREIEDTVFKKLINYLTIKETYFFRDRGHFEILRKYVLPEVITEKEGEKKISIWSAGCSTGEEAYSIAMVLHRFLNNRDEWNIKILATDINSEYIDSAKTGLYDSWSFRDNLQNEEYADYFIRRSDSFEITPEIKKMVDFVKHNLMDGYSVSFPVVPYSLDIIFCRNVMIYFKKNVIKTLIKMFYALLAPNGFLIVSNSDLIFPLPDGFRILNFRDAVVLQKTEKRSADILNQEEKYVSSVDEKKSIGLKEVAYREKHLLLNEKKADELLKQCRDKVEQDPDWLEGYIKIAMILTNKGELEEAHEWCTKALQKDKLCTEAYYILSLIFEEQNNFKDALESLKKVLYIDNSFIPAHYHTGNLYYKLRDFKAGDKCYENAVKLLKSKKEDDIIPLSDELTVRKLLEIIDGVIHKRITL